MIKRIITHKVCSALLFFGVIVLLGSCGGTAKEAPKMDKEQKAQPSAVMPVLKHYKLILGDGSNAGVPVNFDNDRFFYTESDKEGSWVVYKTPNAGNTHGTSNNTRTELAQSQKWFAESEARMTATCKVMQVSKTGDARVAASYSVVIGQIHSADGHENEPLKIFYKKFPGHEKGSIFWNYEINTAGDDNSGRWDYSYPVWGYDFSVIGTEKDDFPAEPKDGIKLGEEISYEVLVKEGIMTLKFMSKGHETKTFTKNIVQSEYASKADMPEQVQDLFVPIGQDGIERKEAYTGEGLFFKQGAYNQTNGKDPVVNKVWCAGAEVYGGDVQKQYETGNYVEVWFKESSIENSRRRYF